MLRASAGFCSTTYEVMLAPSLEGVHSVAAKKEQIEQKETKVTKFLFELKLNQPAPRRIRDSLSPANDIHFGEDAFHV